MLIRLMILAVLISSPGCSRRPSDSGSTPAPAPSTAGEVPSTAGGAPSSTAVKTASIQEEAWTAIRGGALLVDVRSQNEFDQGHLEGAALIPHDQIASRASELGSDKSRPIVLYCPSGNRSARAKRTLEGLGYTNVMNAGAYESLKRAQ